MLSKLPHSPSKGRYDPADMAARGRIGIYTALAKYGPLAMSAAGRAAFLAKFERLVDPEGLLPPEERAQRAREALREHMRKVSAIGVRKRTGRDPRPRLTDEERRAELARRAEEARRAREGGAIA